MLSCKKGLTTIFELRNYFQQKDGLQTQISKQAYLQQRKRFLDIQIASVTDSENELAKKNLNHLKTVGMERPVTAIFDRGYPSLELIGFLETEGISYLFRLSCNDYKAERRKMKPQDGIVHLGHTSARLSKIRKKHPERYKWMKEKRETTARIPRSILPSGQELVLLTDLPVEVTAEQLADLYYQRWEIEKKYHT